MVNAYANMSVPPRSHEVRRIAPPPGGLLAFNLVAALPAHVPPEAALAWFRRFAAEHAAEIAAAPTPHCFIVPQIVPASPAQTPWHEGHRPEVPLPFVTGTATCADPVLVAAVLGRVAGNLYIPGRPVRLGKELLGRWYLFPKSEFPKP